MNDFIHELWHDLREKRLAPVAILLLVALVAVPVVMLKPAANTDPGSDAPVAPVQAKTASDLLPVDLDEDTKGSSLSAFDAKNPFKSPVKKRSSSKAFADLAKAVDSGSDDSGSDSGKSASGGSTSGGSTGGGGSVPTAPKPPKRRTQAYTYVLDVTFVNKGRLRRISGLRKLDMLPSQDNPLLLFVGVDAGADNAVFLVDSALKANGEGSCKPSPSECGMVAIGPGSEHYFTDADGNTYEIRVDEIRKVKVSSANKAGASSKGHSKRFSMPLISDGADVAMTGTDD